MFIKILIYLLPYFLGLFTYHVIHKFVSTWKIRIVRSVKKVQKVEALRESSTDELISELTNRNDLINK
jgi:hypothetical protein